MGERESESRREREREGERVIERKSYRLLARKRLELNADINVNERLIETKVKMSWDNNFDRQAQTKQKRLDIIRPS